MRDWRRCTTATGRPGMSATTEQLAGPILLTRRPSLALENLRSFVILLVLSFHSVLAYLQFLPAAPRATPATCATCTGASTSEPARSRTPQTARSCRAYPWSPHRQTPSGLPGGNQTTPGAFRRLRHGGLPRLARGGVALRRQRVETTARSIRARGDFGIFAPAHQHAHFFESPERAVESAVRREQPAIGDIRQVPRDFVAVEFGRAVAMQIRGADANGEFQRDERTRFPPHPCIISRYMLIRQPARPPGPRRVARRMA